MTEWRERAACLAAVKAGEASTDWWFPSGDKSEVAKAQRRAQRVCATCPVTAECLEENIDEPYGVYGGQGERRRRGIRQGARPIELRPVIRICAECGTEFEADPMSRTNACSKRCRDDRRQRRKREDYEIRSGLFPDHEGSRKRYQRGCRCSRCREAERNYMRDYRSRQEDVA